MPNTRSSNQALHKSQPAHQTSRAHQAEDYTGLRRELVRRRAALVRDAMGAPLTTTEPQVFSDPMDQAAADQGQHEIELLTIRAVEKLRRVDEALASLSARCYGICRGCGQKIPYARLTVQPDARHCVPCQTALEHWSEN